MAQPADDFQHLAKQLRTSWRACGLLLSRFEAGDIIISMLVVMAITGAGTYEMQGRRSGGLCILEEDAVPAARANCGALTCRQLDPS
jgi:hypothetical protein